MLDRAVLARAGLTRTRGVGAGLGDEYADPGRYQDRDDQADDPAAHRAELGPFRVQQLAETVPRVTRGRAIWRDGGHGVTPGVAGAARNSTASRVSSM